MPRPIPAKRTNEIARFAHCKRCGSEKPPTESMMEWARLNVGITPDGDIQVWCVRHDLNVMHTGDFP